MADSKLSLKLLVNSHTKKVLFAEADKDCVDFLFHILSLPISSVIRLLQEEEMVGSLANLYESIENLNDTYIQPGQSKDALLKTPSSSAISPVPLLFLEYAPTVKTFYRCSNGGSRSSTCSSYVSDSSRAICTGCSGKMTVLMKYVAPPVVAPQATMNEGGFVKGVVTYMVMYDLVVQPMSTISSLTLLNKFNVKDVGALQEKVVDIGLEEAVKLLKVSLISKKVLTDVFVHKK